MVLRRLRTRRGELEQAVLARVRMVVPDPAGEQDAEYLEGLRATVAAAIDYCLTGLEQGEQQQPIAIPVEAVKQARRAARGGVGLDVVLRRYMVGQASFSDFILEEVDRLEPEDGGNALRGILRTLAALLDALVSAVAREYVGERERAGRTREHRLLERVRLLLAGERVDGAELGYELDGEHLGVIVRGAVAQEALQRVAQRLDRRLLCVPCGEGTLWAWLRGQHGLKRPELECALSDGQLGVDVTFAVGESAGGLEGWRLTHRQAQEALLVALRRPQRLTHYADVALLAAALRDDTLSRSLIGIYLAPLEDARGGGPAPRETLRAYLTAERNVSSAAVGLGVARSTVVNRLRAIEERLGRTLHSCPAELEVALHLDQLGVRIPKDSPAIE